MSRSIRRRHYHVYQDLRSVAIIQDRQQAWRRVSQLAAAAPETTGWNVLACQGQPCRPYLQGI